MENIICSISGRVALAFSPSALMSTGTWRQPYMLYSILRISRSTIQRQVSCAPKSSLGRNTIPTASLSPLSLCPVLATCSMKNSRGIAICIPAPSPVIPSASTAPLCQIARSALIAASTTAREGLPLMAATNPTPQLSCSHEGS